MGLVFYDYFSMIDVSFMHLKYYLGHHLQKYGLQNGSFTHDIGILLLREMR